MSSHRVKVKSLDVEDVREHMNRLEMGEELELPCGQVVWWVGLTMGEVVWVCYRERDLEGMSRCFARFSHAQRLATLLSDVLQTDDVERVCELRDQIDGVVVLAHGQHLRFHWLEASWKRAAQYAALLHKQQHHPDLMEPHDHQDIKRLKSMITALLQVLYTTLKLSQRAAKSLEKLNDVNL